MKRRMLCFLALLLAACWTVPCLAAEGASPEKLPYAELIEWVKAEKPAALDLGETKLTLQQLRAVKAAMPAESSLRFMAEAAGVRIGSEQTAVDFDGSKKHVRGQDIEDLIALLPGLKRITAFKHLELTTAVMGPIVDAHPEIDFGWTIQFGRDGKKYHLRSDATAFSTLKGHKKPLFTSEEIAVLRYAKGLKAIDVGHNHIRELDWLLDFPDLRILILADNQVSDLTPLAELKNLEYVELFLNRFTDVTPLAGLTKLVDLNLSHNSISDLSPLDGLTGLERFFCSYTDVTDAEKERFKALHPDCKTNFIVYSSVGAGWREHWRYEQYTEMFKTRIWHEFEAPAK